MSKIFESSARAQAGLSGIGLELGLASTTQPMASNLAKQAERASDAEPGNIREIASSSPLSAPGAPRKLPLRVPASSPTFPFDGTHPYASEQYRMLRTKLMHHPKHPRVLVVASAGPRDGKTTTSINLAAVFALRSEARILLIDGDIRRPSVAPQLGLPDDLGLADVLSGKCTLDEALIQTEQIPNLYILPAGRADSNPSEMLASAAWKNLASECAGRYNYVFIDSPPIAAVADFELIQASCDGAVMVIRQDHTRRRQGLECLRQIAKDKLLGVVVNSVTAWPLDGRRRYDSYYTTYQNSFGNKNLQ